MTQSLLVTQIIHAMYAILVNLFVSIFWLISFSQGDLVNYQQVNHIIFYLPYVTHPRCTWNYYSNDIECIIILTYTMF